MSLRKTTNLRLTPKAATLMFSSATPSGSGVGGGSKAEEREALEEYERLSKTERAAVEWPPQQWTIVLNALAEKESVEAKELEEAFGYVTKPGLDQFNSLIKAYEIRKSRKGAEFVVDRMLENYTKPDAVTFGSLLKVYADNNDVYGAGTVLERTELVGDVPDVEAFNTLLKLHKKHSKNPKRRGKEILKWMARVDVKPNDETNEILAEIGI